MANEGEKKMTEQVVDKGGRPKGAKTKTEEVKMLEMVTALRDLGVIKFEGFGVSVTFADDAQRFAVVQKTISEHSVKKDSKSEEKPASIDDMDAFTEAELRLTDPVLYEELMERKILNS